jgi:hypothetical protein
MAEAPKHRFQWFQTLAFSTTLSGVHEITVRFLGVDKASARLPARQRAR